MTGEPLFHLRTGFVMGGMAARPRPAAGPGPTAVITEQDVALAFESLGDNCEFGIFQRYAGVEPLGLLRFNFTPLDSLIRGLENSFADLAEPGQVEAAFDAALGEWMISETKYSFSYHTYNKDTSQNAETLRDTQSRWMKYMARILIETISLGEKIFIRKGEPPREEPAIRALSAALRRHGNATLLWVCVPDRGQQPNTVEWLAPGLMRGWIESLASYTDVMTMYAAPWFAVCKAALGLHRLGHPAALQVRQPKAPGRLFLGAWGGTDAATTTRTWDIPPPKPGMAIMRHRLVEDCGHGRPVFGCLIEQGVDSGALYTASILIWLPQDFTGTRAWLELLGRPRAASHPADVSRRGVWQRIWVSAFLMLEQVSAFPQLHVAAPAGARLFSCGWRLDPGDRPADQI